MELIIIIIIIVSVAVFDGAYCNYCEMDDGVVASC